MAATLVQLCIEPSVAADVCVQRIAELAGLRVVISKTCGEALAELQRVKTQSLGPVILATSGQVMTRLQASTNPSDQTGLKELRALANFFIYGFSPESDAELTQYLSDFGGNGSIATLPAGQMTYQFNEAARPPLAGLSFTSLGDQPVTVFSDDAAKTAQILLAVNTKPILLRRRYGVADDYFLSQAPRINVDTPVAPPHVPHEYQGEILPVALAIKQMFADHCWHNPFPVACVVIDDPWLQKRYGFFNYDDVLSELAAGNYTTTVAFIPSNYRRNDPRVVAQVAANVNHLSFCIHGCDHTGGEFGETDALSIESKAAGGMDKMVKFQELTGLNFDAVMVFPQGVYSSCSLPALKHCGYLAAVNTVPYPTDFATAPVTLADIFDLAITRYGSFPLFTRHYPRSTFDFAIDLFWGKPVLLVEHHGFYRDGASRVTEFVSQLRKLEPRLEWLTLTKALTQSGHYQLAAPGLYTVKFATANFQLCNPSPLPACFECRKPETEPGRIKQVLVDKQPVAYQIEDGHMCLKVELGAHEQCVIMIQYQAYQPARLRQTLKYRVKAFVRRRLSEIRDNHLSRNDRVIALAKSVKRWLRA